MKRFWFRPWYMMNFKAFVLVLVLPVAFFLEAYDAKLINALDKQELDEIPLNEEVEEEDELSTKTETKRGLKPKKSFEDLSWELARLHILEETVRKSKAITNLQNEVNEYSQDKCSMIKKVGDPIVHHHSGSTQGTWMRDPLGLLGPEKIWYIDGYHGNTVLEFESMDHFKAGEIAKTYTLPFKIDGTGSVVYGRHLYFNRENTNYIVQYDLKTEKITGQAAPHGSVKPRQYVYQWSGHTTFDLSVDESGLWVLYSYPGYSGKLCATLLDPLTMKSVTSYYGVSSVAMTSMGNAFVACGIVYSIEKYNGDTTTINYAYDTTTKSATNPGIQFVNKFGYNSMVTYNPREKVLYAWDNHRQITYPLEFED